MGPFPTMVRQLKFLVVGIDYFTKWVEAEVLATITKKKRTGFHLEMYHMQIWHS